MESGGEGEQQLQVVNSDREELFDVDGSGGGKELYYDSLVNQARLYQRPSEQASPRPATNRGSSARRLTTDTGLSVELHSNLYHSRPQSLAKDKNVAFASDQKSAFIELSDTSQRSGAENRATRGSGSDLEYSATIQSAHSEVSSSRKSIASAIVFTTTKHWLTSGCTEPYTLQLLEFLVPWPIKSNGT